MVYKNVPGVRIEEISLLPPSVAGVDTGIPAFIGHTEKALTVKGLSLLNKAVKIFSFRDYEELYGMPQPENDGLEINITDFVTADAVPAILSTKVEAKFDETKRSKHIMYYALKLYFDNGGGPCYVLSIGDYSNDGQTVDYTKLDGGLKLLESEDEPTIIVVPEAIYLSTANYFNLYKSALQQAADLKDRFVVLDVKETGDVTADINNFRNDAAAPVDHLNFGAAYYPYLNTTIDYNYFGQEANVVVKRTQVKPDGSPVPQPNTTLSALKAVDNLLYEAGKAQLAEIPMKLPPSAAIAGVYSRVDSERGVWKAPANVGIASIVGPSIKVTDAHQHTMNIDPSTGKSVNAIRFIAGRGTVVWGGRTLDGNSNEWRYISVRRFFNFVEESVKKASYRFVFEPNDANTWVKVRGMIENFLTLQWREGALMGAKPEQAFFVRVGVPQTMTENDVMEGRMNVEIGMAVVRPAEFIILKFSHKMMTQS